MKPAAVMLALLLAGCAGPETTAPVAVRPAPPAPAPPAAAAAAVAPRAQKPPPTASPEDIARARALVDRGVKLYRDGQYAQAEEVLKQGITLYPFMADANLVLAKIMLIRASATRDMTLYTNARLMLEMARALDPSSREVEQLLELVRQPTAE